MTYKVFIPSAGLGSRLGPFSKFFNKALITVGNKPTIAHIIDQVPEAVQIVIALGYRAEQLKQVLLAMYPNRDIQFIFVDNCLARSIKSDKVFNILIG